MTSTIIAHSLNGVTIGQRSVDGFINGTAICVACGKDISDWLKTDDTLELVEALAQDLGINPKNHSRGNSVYVRVSATYPTLVMVKRGSPETGGGTWVHPDLAVQLAQWSSKPFGIQVSRWVQKWMLTGQNPVKSNTKTSAQRDLERFEERIRLKDEARLALSDVVKEWMEYHGWYHDRKRVSKYFIALMDGINVAITTETSQQMQKRLAAQLGRKPKSGELIRDYFPVEELRLYLSVHNVLTNLLLMVPIGERNGLQYLNQAIALALPRTFQATPISFETQSYLQGSQTELALA